MTNTQRHLISALTTFGVAFLISLGAQLGAAGTFEWSSAVVSSVFFTALRAAAKASIEMFMTTGTTTDLPPATPAA